MKCKLILLVLSFCFLTCKGQESRWELQLMECLYTAQADNGEAFKKLMSDYEKLLIREKILDGATGKDYIKIYQKMADLEVLEYSPSQSFLGVLKDLPPNDKSKVRECEKALIDGRDIEEHKAIALERKLDSLFSYGNNSASQVAKTILEVLDERDLELDYYKLRTLFVIDLISAPINPTAFPSEMKTANIDPTMAIQLHLNEESRLFIRDMEIDSIGLVKAVKRHVAKYESDATILLKVDNKALYRDYTKTLEIISSVVNQIREEYSIEQYGKPLNDLSEEKQREIRNKYPNNIVGN